jgi:hypothetical protein
MHMGTTGWLGEQPDEVPAMPVTEMLLARQQHRASPLETALARSAAAEAREAREQAANAPDPDERAANLVTRGYRPGLLNELAQRLGDTTAELEAEREKIDKAARRAEIAFRQHAAGRVDVFRMRAMMDGDEGDEARVAVLERRAESLRRQIGEAQEMIAPPRARDLDPVEAAVKRARDGHREYVEAFRAQMAGARARVPERRPPFVPGSVSRGAGDAAECTGPDCQVCAWARAQDAARAAERGRNVAVNRHPAVAAQAAAYYPEAVR